MKQQVKLVFMGRSPIEMSRLLGINATEQTLAGTPRPDGGSWKHNSWALSSGVPEAEIDSEVHFRALLARLKECWPKVLAISEQVEAVVSWVVRVDNDQSGPVASLGPDTLAKLSELGATLDVDISAG